jgi:choline transport protein
METETTENGEGYELKQQEVPSESQDGAEMTANKWSELSDAAKVGFTENDQRDMQRMGKKQEFRRNFQLVTTVGFTSCVMGVYLPEKLN